MITLEDLISSIHTEPHIWSEVLVSPRWARMVYDTLVEQGLNISYNDFVDYVEESYYARVKPVR